MNYKDWRNLPFVLKDDQDNKVLVHGYILQAKEEGRKEENVRHAERLLGIAFKEATELAGESFVKEWLARANERV